MATFDIELNGEPYKVEQSATLQDLVEAIERIARTPHATRV